MDFKLFQILCCCLFILHVRETQQERKTVPDECEASYTEGSLTNPCGFCAICMKKRRPDNSSYNNCFLFSYLYKKFVLKETIIFISYKSSGNQHCLLRNYCTSKIKPFTVEEKEFDCARCASNHRGCVTMLGTCKCVCSEKKYGQQCEYSLPSGISLQSFADVRNVVFNPYVYVNDFATISLYFYNTGTNLQVEIQTEHQVLTFDSEHCVRNAQSIAKRCEKIFEDSGTFPYDKSCHGGSTYESHADQETCVINANIAFSRDQPDDINKDLFIMDYRDEIEEDFLKKNIAAKMELVTVVVKNTIPNVKNTIVHLDKFGLFVIYSGKNTFEDCLPFVKIPKFSNNMQNASHFPRRKSISVTNLVELNDTSHCNNLGEPIVNWYVWNVKNNHDEIKNAPFYQLLGEKTLLFEPFSLAFGKYKVKSEIKFVERKYNRGIAYCYFHIVAIPLQPLIIGGSLRHIYYKSNLKLKTMKSNNPNFPEDQQPKLKYTWLCDDKSTPLCDKVTTENIELIKKAPFIPGKEYEFVMETTNPSTIVTESARQVIVVTSDPIPSLIIKCFKNCGGKGFKSDFREIFYFQVTHSEFSYEVNRNNNYSWTYAGNDQTFKDVSDIRQKEVTPSSVLIVDENSLKSHEIYTFEVVGGGDIPGRAQIQVQIFQNSTEFRCEINPKSGTAGVTLFRIYCFHADFEDEESLSVLYYFYDKSSKEDLTGRLLATTHIQTVEDIILTRGTVAIYAVNMLGHFLETYENVELTHQTITKEMIEANIKEIKFFSENEGYEQKISFLSSFCDILNNNPFLKETVIEPFLEIINKEEVSDMVQIEILLLSTQSVVCDKDECKAALKTDIGYTYLSEILQKISYKLAFEIEFNANKVSSLKTNLLYSSLVKCMTVLLSPNEEMTWHEQIDYKRYNLFKFGNLEAIWSLERVNHALAVVNLPYVKHWAVETELIETWMKTDDPSFFTLGTKGDSEGSYISISAELENDIKAKTDLLTVQVTKFKTNPFWFSLTDDATTEVTLISFGIHNANTMYEPINHFRYPVDIFLKKNPVSQSSMFGSVIQTDPKGDPVKNDQSVEVTRLFPKRGETTSIKFLNMTDGDALRILILINARPDYDLLVTKGVVITKSKPSYTYKAVEGDQDAVYIGIIPGPNVPVGNVVNYKFELEGLRCQTWLDYVWATGGCNLGPKSTEEYFHCQCYHLSAIAGFLMVPANTIDPFQDYTLFLTIPDNPYVFSFVVVLLMVYIFLLVWSVRTDKVDISRRSILILEDNISTDSFGYLLTVVTGSKCYAGTSSTIGVIMHGSETSSRSHILLSTLRRTLQRGDDWFLIFTPKPLGIISSIQLWTDHSGPNPNWFCDSIYIHDLNTKKDYSFLIGKWFGITELGTRFESFARPVKFDKEAHFTEFTITNIVSGLREFHLWMSIFMHHPRSPILRSQRLSIAMVGLISILLASILFYDASLPEVEDLPSYSVTTRELMISIYSLLISVGITEINYLLFKKSFESRSYNILKKDALAYSQQSTEKTGKKNSERLIVDSADKLKVSKASKHNCTYFMKRSMTNLRKHEFHPVKIETETAKDKMCNSFITVFSWIICLSSIFVASFFIVWIGLKIGKVKSYMWLTSILMSFSQDFFVADPFKICIFAVLFGMIQTQLCDVFSYDPSIYKIRTKSKVRPQLKRDNFIHKMRLQSVYKHIPFERQDILKDRLRKVRQWWVLIDTADIVFSSILMFTLISQVVFDGYYQTNTAINQLVLRNINLGKNFVPSPEIEGIENFYNYLQDWIFPEIYRTHWYNKNLLTNSNEILPETGWFGTLTNRLMGVPRLRQIRKLEKKCNLPDSFVDGMHMFCSVPFTSLSEDTNDYGERWIDASWSDVLFRESPWIYLSPKKSSSISMFSESRKLFHGGGYVAELHGTRRRSQSAVLNLLDLEWLDLRTRIVFFEINAYNVNKGIFSSVVLTTEHLRSTLVLAGGGTWSTKIYEENIFLEALFFIYALLCLFKLSMQMKTVGAGVFFQSFWTVYDLLFIVVGVIVLLAFRIFSKVALTFIHEFQSEAKDEHGFFQTMIFYLHLKRYSLGLLFFMAIVRTLRLANYGNTRIFSQVIKTLNNSYPEIFSVTLILMIFMFILQWVISYLANILYPTGYSHLLLRKMEYPSIYKSATSQENIQFIFLPCFISSLAVACIVAILVKNYVWAKSSSKRF